MRFTLTLLSLTCAHAASLVPAAPGDRDSHVRHLQSSAALAQQCNALGSQFSAVGNDAACGAAGPSITPSLDALESWPVKSFSRPGPPTRAAILSKNPHKRLRNPSPISDSASSSDPESCARATSTAPLKSPAPPNAAKRAVHLDLMDRKCCKTRNALVRTEQTKVSL